MFEHLPRIDKPEPGFYLLRLAKGGPFVPVEITRGRVGGLYATLGGEGVLVDRVWPYCAKHPIGASEYFYKLRVKAWAEEHAPDQPEANPRQAVDLNRIKPIF